MMNEKLQRNVQINGTSPMNDILGALDGIWSSSTVNGWNDIHISSRFEIWNRWCDASGSYLLPRTADKTLMAKIFNNDGTVTCSVVKIGQAAIWVSKPCYVEIVNLSENK